MPLHGLLRFFMNFGVIIASNRQQLTPNPKAMNLFVHKGFKGLGDGRTANQVLTNS